jgi:hypothetical protein
LGEVAKEIWWRRCQEHGGLMGCLVAGTGMRAGDELTTERGARPIEGLPVMENWSYSATEQGESLSLETTPLRVTESATCQVAWLAA